MSTSRLVRIVLGIDVFMFVSYGLLALVEPGFLLSSVSQQYIFPYKTGELADELFRSWGALSVGFAFITARCAARGVSSRSDALLSCLAFHAINSGIFIYSMKTDKMVADQNVLSSLGFSVALFFLHFFVAFVRPEVDLQEASTVVEKKAK
eukprot:GILJ01010223.1.p1 GENE.GILJ01010223.1~~GILJ01010223.1.p1  ORF type:complete len:151 (-),score=8.62 GILJ01010223.1:26-478(-)